MLTEVNGQRSVLTFERCGQPRALLVSRPSETAGRFRVWGRTNTWTFDRGSLRKSHKWKRLSTVTHGAADASCVIMWSRRSPKGHALADCVQYCSDQERWIRDDVLKINPPSQFSQGSRLNWWLCGKSQPALSFPNQARLNHAPPPLYAAECRAEGERPRRDARYRE